MKNVFKVVLVLGIITLIGTTLYAGAVEEQNLAGEAATGPDPDAKKMEEKTITINCYANSRDVTITGGVIGALYYFCSEPKKEFCSQYEGVLLVSGADTGKEPEMLKTLDTALEEKAPIVVKLSEENIYMGVKKIVDVKILN